MELVKSDPNSPHRHIFTELVRLIMLRKQQPAFYYVWNHAGVYGWRREVLYEEDIGIMRKVS
jgi:hypothetical protein